MLGQKFPQTAKGISSQDAALKLYEDKKDYVSANSYLAQLVQLNKEPQRLSRLKLAYEDSFFKASESFEAKKKYKKANNYLAAFITKGYDPSKKTMASWNMALNYKKAKSWNNAGAQFTKFYKQNPRHENALPALNEALEIYKKRKQYANVAGTAQLLEVADSGNTQAWKWVKTDNLIKAKSYKTAQVEATNLLHSSDSKVSESMHQRLFDFVEKPRHKFYPFAVATLKRSGKEPFKSEAWYKEAEYAYKSKKYTKMNSNIRVVRGSSSASREVKARATFCLLYTSPSPRDATLSRMPSSA